MQVRLWEEEVQERRGWYWGFPNSLTPPYLPHIVTSFRLTCMVRHVFGTYYFFDLKKKNIIIQTSASVGHGSVTWQFDRPTNQPTYGQTGKLHY